MLIGAVVGIAVALPSTRLLKAMLFEIYAVDAVVFVAMSLTMIAIGRWATSVKFGWGIKNNRFWVQAVFKSFGVNYGLDSRPWLAQSCGNIIFAINCWVGLTSRADHGHYLPSVGVQNYDPRI